jgi:hypothetical protein
VEELVDALLAAFEEEARAIEAEREEAHTDRDG